MECAYKNLTKEEYKDKIANFTSRFQFRFLFFIKYTFTNYI